MFLPFQSSIVRLRNKTEKRLNEFSQDFASFYTLIIFASGIATLGLILDNAAIIIGAMVVAPIVTPIFGIALSLLIFRIHRLYVSLVAIVLSTMLVVVVSSLMTYLTIFIEGANISLSSEIISRASPNLLFFIVALFSGMAGAFSYAKPKLLASVTGIAISVAILPPLAVTGIGVALTEWQLAQQSFLLYTFNLAGISFGSIIMFVILGFARDIEK